MVEPTKAAVFPDRSTGEPAPAPPEEVGRDLCSIKEIVRAINELERELKRSHGLTLIESLCLCCISGLSQTPGECARQIGLSPSRLSRILNSLEKKGLLERHPLPGDRRITGLSITEEGQVRLRELRGSGYSFSRLETLIEAQPRTR